jgi:hypothetical protein
MTRGPVVTASPRGRGRRAVAPEERRRAGEGDPGSIDGSLTPTLRLRPKASARPVSRGERE